MNTKEQIKHSVDENHFSRVLAVGRLVIDLQSCRVAEDIQVMRCFKCSRFNHKSKDCQYKLACHRCGEHELVSCKSNVEKCVNCEHAVKTYNVKYDANHSATDRNCNVYLKKLHMLRRKIEYNKQQQQEQFLNHQCIYFNLCGAINNLNSVRCVIKKHKPLLLFMSETHLTNDVQDFEISCDGYQIIRCDSHSKRTGGVLIYIKKKYPL